MAAISALMVNEVPLRTEHLDGEKTPTTPRAAVRMASPPIAMDTTMHGVADDQQRSTGVDQNQSNLDSNGSPLSLTTENLQKATRTQDSPDAMDIDQEQDDQDGGSDNDTEQGDPNAASRKKKGQRFFCTGYPPCNLSFTRSEHLARHIRKHTGERPFQCHCNRRFSRLDNLRQHAQTVHVNEEIPTDSLAATGTRFQRQIRTDRVRPTGRPRSGTMSSTGTHSRGHSRNLSTSSIGSTSSNFSTSTIDPRRRPPPLLMAGDGRPKLGIDPPSTPPQQYTTYATHSPSDIKTPTSATFSNNPGSPAFGSNVASPLGPTSRGAFYPGTRTPGRRLSVPSAPNGFSSPFHPTFSAYPNQPGPPSANLSSNNSTITSPTTPTFPHATGISSSSGEDWRRRTWHPSTYSGLNLNYNRPATSGLTYSQTPDAPQPAFAQNATAAAGQAPRLPGIESFDHVQQRPTTPPRNNSTGFNADASRPPTLMPPVDFRGHSRGLGHRRHVSADVLRYSSQPFPQDHPHQETSSSGWMQDTMTQSHQLGSRPLNQAAEPSRSPMAPPSATTTTNITVQPLSSSQPLTQDARNTNGPPATPRTGWHQRSVPATRVSPEDSGSSEGVPTPGTSIVDVNPTIMPTSGVLDGQHAAVPFEGGQDPCFQTPTLLPPLTGAAATNHVRYATHDHNRSDGRYQLNRLDALAAVATSGGNEQVHS